MMLNARRVRLSSAPEEMSPAHRRGRRAIAWLPPVARLLHPHPRLLYSATRRWTQRCACRRSKSHIRGSLAGNAVISEITWKIILFVTGCIVFSYEEDGCIVRVITQVWTVGGFSWFLFLLDNDSLGSKLYDLAWAAGQVTSLRQSEELSRFGRWTVDH